MEPKGSLLCLQRPVTCPYPELDQSIPCPPSQFPKIHFNIICAWVFQIVSFPQVPPPKPCMCISSPPYCATCPTQLILLNLITQISVEHYRRVSSSCSFLHSPVTSSLLGPYIPLSNLLSNTLSLHTSRNLNDHVSHL